VCVGEVTLKLLLYSSRKMELIFHLVEHIDCVTLLTLGVGLWRKLISNNIVVVGGWMDMKIKGKV
jgi:hypothetical protein